MTVRLAIDGENFAGDRRGMGRLAQSVVEAAIASDAFTPTLLYKREATAQALRERFGTSGFSIAAERKARSRRRFDVCYFPWNGIRYRSGAPAVVMLHDVFAFTEPAKGSVARFREQSPIRRTVRRAARVIVNSAWSAAQAELHLAIDPARIVVAPLVPRAFFSPGRPGPLPRALGSKRFILFVSGREARKNAGLMFEAAARALDPARETLVIAGSIARADALRLRAYRTPHVRIDANDDLLRSLYRGAAIVCVPSRAEGFGLVAAEAMACGAPVIAANSAALPEACGGDAMLIDPLDAGAWTQAIRLLLDDRPLRDSYARLGRLRWESIDRSSYERAVLRVLDETAQRG